MSSIWKYTIVVTKGDQQVTASGVSIAGNDATEASVMQNVANEIAITSPQVHGGTARGTARQVG